MKISSTFKNLSIVIWILVILSVVSYYYRFGIYTKYWHLTHPEPIKWYGLKITVPETMVARVLDNQDGNKDVQIYYRANAEQADIAFLRVNYHLKKDFDFDEKYQIAGYKIIEKESYNIIGNPCIWIKSHRIAEEPIYKEDIFFESKDIWVSFIGYEEKRHYLLEVINKLEIL